MTPPQEPPPLPGDTPATARPPASPPPVTPPPLPGEVEDETADDPALLHVTELTRTYPCRHCGGQLEFAIPDQKLVCPHCGGAQDIVDDPNRSVEERDFRSALAAVRAEHGSSVITGEKEVVCQNCGGHTTFTGTLTSTRCPYCATPIQRDDVHDAPARLSVDGVLPFQVDRKQAEAALQEWINSRWFAPGEFKQYTRTGSFASVYAAYFTYDADTDTWYRGRRGDDYTVTVGSGDNRRTEIRTRWRNVSGEVHDRFDDVCVLANEGFDRGKVEKLEPWPLGGVRPFTPQYIAGHLCRTYDHDVEECFAEARRRMDEQIRQTIRRDIGGDHQDIREMRTTFNLLTFKHLLLPIWLLTVIFQGRPFQVVINGATGEVHGQRPYSAVKIAFAVALAVIVALAAFLAWKSSQGT